MSSSNTSTAVEMRGSAEKSGPPPKQSGLAKTIAKVTQLRPVRAAQRYSRARGALFAGGIAYSALFSIFAALTIAWTVFMATLGNDAQLRSQVIDAINQVLPGVLDDGTNGGLINPDSLVQDTVFTPASVIAALVALWTAISIMTNIRVSVQSMFGIATPGENFVLQKLRDLVGFVAMAIGIVLSAVLGTAAGTLGDTVVAAVGLTGNPVVSFFVRLLGLLVAAGVAALTFAFLFRVTANVRALKRDLWLGSAVGGIAVQIVLTLGTSLVTSSLDNPIAAASATLVTLLLFVNLLCRVLLIVAAFTANPPSPKMPDTPEEVHYNETPNFVTLSAPHTLKWNYQGATGQIQVDDNLDPEADRYSDARDGTSRKYDARPDGAPIPAEKMDAEARRELVAHILDLEEEVVAQRARLGQRPRVDLAEKEYWGRRMVLESRQNRALRGLEPGRQGGMAAKEEGLDHGDNNR